MRVNGRNCKPGPKVVLGLARSVPRFPLSFHPDATLFLVVTIVVCFDYWTQSPPTNSNGVDRSKQVAWSPSGQHVATSLGQQASRVGDADQLDATSKCPLTEGLMEASSIKNVSLSLVQCTQWQSRPANSTLPELLTCDWPCEREADAPAAGGRVAAISPDGLIGAGLPAMGHLPECLVRLWDLRAAATAYRLDATRELGIVHRFTRTVAKW